ncbi:MAG: GTP-binding protein [Saprospiraceae bacterium]|jgi:GTP-binding protein
MNIKEAMFTGSFATERQCPQDNKPEYAFIGRSNVGKSSLINMICSRKDLARVSNTPGKTQTLNYYLVDKSWYIVDLPGYGYAKISKTKRFEWEKMIEGYMLKRNTLGCAFVLIDLNVPPQEIDMEFLNWMGKMKIPFVIVFTKTDRMKLNDQNKNLKAFQNEMHKYWNDLPEQFITSATKRIGQGEILEFIENLNAEFHGQTTT